MNETQTQSQKASVSASLYIVCQALSNILSTKIALIPFLNLAVDGGTILYPFSFTLRDFVHKTLGKTGARKIVFLGATVSLVVSLMFYLVGKLPADPSWPFQEAYEKVLMPVFRITLASLVAQLLSELLDTEVFSILYGKLGQIASVLISNLFSVTFDSIVFCFFAFYGNLPTLTIWQIILANVIIKIIISFIISPIIKFLPETQTQKI